jgi:hypothetical protein
MTESSISRRDSLRNIVAISAAGVAVAVGAGALTAAPADAAQPHMNHALSDLQAALHQLQVAIPDKAGHRIKAIALVQQAISETSAGMAAGAM